jgi:hydrogenase expression/formation protein HypC
MRITAVDGQLATIVAAGLEQQCSVMLVPEAAVGDYVLVHAGFALQVLNEGEARASLAELTRLAALMEDETADDDSREAP